MTPDLPARLQIIEAPTNLGLRPLRPGHEPGTWQAPPALRAAGLHERLGHPKTQALAAPAYSPDAAPGSRIRNGPGIRRHGEDLGRVVAQVLKSGDFPLVLGGDCSILLGCLAGARTGGRCGLVHVDGHSDFFNPGPENTNAPFAAAGMDLALATGRGEPLLACWGDPSGPLIEDADVSQLGERENLDADFAYPEIADTAIRQFDIRTMLERGIARVSQEVATWAADRQLLRVWLHVDVDVLDQEVMPAVDCPGSPGLNFGQLAELIVELRKGLPLVGSNVTVFDPDLDPDGGLARELARTLARGFGA